MADRDHRDVKRNRSPRHRVLYANQVGCTTTPNDIRLRFGCVERVTESEIAVEDQVDVFINVQTLVGLTEMLRRQVRKLGIVEIDEPIISKDSGEAPQEG